MEEEYRYHGYYICTDGTRIELDVKDMNELAFYLNDLPFYIAEMQIHKVKIE